MNLRKTIANWGQFPAIEARMFHANSAQEVSELRGRLSKLIPRGMGRCYGDAALNSNVLSTQGLSKVLHFDREQGIIQTEAGVSFAQVLAQIVPGGWFLPVTPGTKFVSVGGAIAADIHGKNHHKEGCFSNYVLTLKLLLEDGTLISCSREENNELFQATCGGMGLTGVIIEATFRLKRIETSLIQQESIDCKNLSEMLRHIEENADSTYSVAWIDCLARGKKLGRGVLYLGEHAALSEIDSSLEPLHFEPKQKINVPFFAPGFLLNRLTIGAFNSAYYRLKRNKGKEQVGLDGYFYPLDEIGNWNRLYGKKGFVQYQFVLPHNTAHEGLREILERITESGQGSFLAVLKLFGASNGMLSFPMEGYTLALDFPVHKKVLGLLDQLDQLVIKHKGRIYLAKDARMKSEVFRDMYSDRADFESINNEYNPKQKFSSLLSRRLDLTASQRVLRKTVLILGARSGIAQAVAQRYADAGYDLVLAYRGVEQNRLDLGVTDAMHLEFDALDEVSHANLINSMGGVPEGTIVCFGYLGDQSTAENDWSEAHKILDTNLKGAISVCERIADALEDASEASGSWIVGVSSVAGERGRKSNYFYGTAKAGFTAYLSGLRHRLHKKGIKVLTVKPGFVRTAMTEGMYLPARLTAEPDQVATAVYKAQQKGKSVIYVKPIWRLIMWIIRSVPERIFVKTDL